MYRFLQLFFLLLLSQIAIAQYKLMGDGAYMDNGCIRLTADEPYSEGIAYNLSKLNLSLPFQIEFDIYLGDKNELGADGITFVIHDDERGFEAFGTYGECLGYGRWRKDYLGGNYIAPSVAIEFDTYYNSPQNDPPCDHIAFLSNGTNFHETTWTNNSDTFNLEDDLLHDFQFSWNPKSKKVVVSLDGMIAYKGNIDLIGDVFYGKTNVIWGFTASTGNKYNLQYFCLKRLAYLDNDHSTDDDKTSQTVPLNLNEIKNPAEDQASICP
jgi:hypothetical protein